MMTEQLAFDTPTHRRHINEMPDDEIELLLEDLRVRRLQAYNAYAEGQELKKQAKTEKQYDRLVKVCNRMEKEISAIDTKLEKLDVMVRELRALRLEIEG